MFIRDTPGRTALHKENFISVAICANDRPDFLHRVIDAVHKHADMPYEIVVADDAGHRHPDLSYFQQFRDKVSRLVVNLGANQGLAVNANQAIAATHARNVVFLSDDSIIMRPFMRQVFTVLDEAPYVGLIYLGQTYNPKPDFHPVGREFGLLRAKTRSGTPLMLHCHHGASWASAFRKSYWFETEGYAEDDIYGDLPFCNKGWLRGYFSAAIGGEQIAYDVDVVECDKKRSSVPFQAHNAFCHYPRLFGLDERVQIKMAQERTAACAGRNHNGRRVAFNEYDCNSWVAYMKRATASVNGDWNVLSEHHGRFRTELTPDLEP